MMHAVCIHLFPVSYCSGSECAVTHKLIDRAASIKTIVRSTNWTAARIESQLGRKQKDLGLHLHHHDFDPWLTT